MTRRGPWRSPGRLTLVAAAAIIAVSGCSSHPPDAEADARRRLQAQVDDIKALASDILANASDATAAQRTVAAARPSLYGGTANDGSVEWDAVLTATGDDNINIGPNPVALRACVRFRGRVGSPDVEAADLECPARFEHSNRFGVYDKTVRLLQD